MARIALHGGLLAGKTELAKRLREQHGYLGIDYTGMLKTFAAAALQGAGLAVTSQDIVADKERFRPFLIELGHLLDFDHGFAIDRIVEQLGSDMTNVVFDNVRFAEQYELLRPAGFILVRVVTPWAVRLERALRSGMTPQEFNARCADASEKPLPRYPGEIAIDMGDSSEKAVKRLLSILARRDERANRRLADSTGPSVLRA